MELGEEKEENAPKEVADELMWMKKVEEWVSQRGNDPIIPFSVEYEKDYLFEKEEEELLRWEEEEKRAKGDGSADPSASEVDSSSLTSSLDRLLAEKSRTLPSSFFSHSGSQLEKIVSIGYEHLSLCHYFTCGEDEVKCWTIRFAMNREDKKREIGEREKRTH